MVFSDDFSDDDVSGEARIFCISSCKREIWMDEIQQRLNSLSAMKCVKKIQKAYSRSFTNACFLVVKLW